MYQAVIVDDEAFIVDGLKNAIDWDGYGIEISYTSTNPVVALDYIRRNPVHLLITDVSMPEMDGLELMKQAKEITPLLSVIVLSAYDHFEYVRTSLRFGAENYLLKPLDPDELTDAISQIVNHMQERQELTNSYGRAMLTFRSNFIENWAKSSLSNDDIKTKASLLGIDLNADNYFVVIFSSIDNNSLSMSTFFDHLLSFLPGLFIGHFYFENPYRLVCIFTSLDENISKTQTSSFIDEVIKSATKLQLPVFASVGTTIHHYSDVGRSFQQARSLQFIKYTGIPFFLHEDFRQVQTIMDKYYSVFQKNDISKVCQLIEALFTNKLSHSTAKLLTINILSHLLQQIENDVDDLFMKYPDFVTLLCQFPSEGTQQKEYKFYSLNFARQCSNLQEIIQQSMYPCVDAVINAVNNFSDKDISLKTLANKLNVTPSYLGTVFKQQTGCYFNDFLSEARLKHAAYLIRNSDIKMKDVVEKVGFSSQTYFNRSFKRYYNMSPVAYRRQKNTNLT